MVLKIKDEQKDRRFTPQPWKPENSKEKTVSRLSPNLLLSIILQNTWTLQFLIKIEWNYLQKIIKR